MGSRFRRVAVLMGGVSSEREISLTSGRAVLQGLRDAGYDAVPVVLDREDFELPDGTEAVFIALHGRYGEDGGVQAALDRRAIPYVGAGAAASRLAFDKILSKRRLTEAGVPTPRYEVLSDGDSRGELEPPVVVKPPRQGSSVGIGWVLEEADWDNALAEARRYDGEVLVEQYIAGREWTVGIIGNRTLPVIEIVAPRGRYDLKAKYTAGVTRYVVLDQQDEPAALRCRSLALTAFECLGARGFGRVDFRVDRDGGCYVLELNTIPGFTPTSLLPKAAAAAGIPFHELCARIMEGASFDGQNVPGGVSA